MGWNVFISANIGYYVWKWEMERVARIDGRRESRRERYSKRGRGKGIALLGRREKG